MATEGEKRQAEYAKKYGTTGGGFARGLCVNCDRPMKGSHCEHCDKPKSAKSHDLKNKKKNVAGKMAGKKIASMERYWRDIKKSDPHSYSYPFHQARAIEKEYPEQFKRYKESKRNK